MKSLRILNKATLFIALLDLIHPVWALTASVNKNQFNLSETIQLSLSGDSQTPFQSMDLAPLNNDFDIIHRSHERHVVSVNGQFSEKVKLNLLLKAKQHGHLMIPSLKVGNDQTAAIQIQVSQQSTSAPNDQPVFLEVQWVGAEPTYVQSQLTLKVKIRHDGTLQRGELEPPQVEDAMVNRLSTNTTSQENINGRIWQVVERHFAVTPLKSGTLTVAPLQFRGQVGRKLKNSNRTVNNYFEPFWGQTVTLQTPALQRDILPPVAAYTGRTWLPAKSLTLSASSLSQTEFKVGDPINLNLDIEAVGLLAEQLPGVQMDALPDSIGVYPDDPILSNQFSQTDILGKFSLTIVLIPAIAGAIDLPELGITWWNTLTNKQETAKLKLPSFKVIDAAGVGTEGDNTLIELNAPLNTDRTADPDASAVIRADLTNEPLRQDKPIWKWIALGTLCGWLLTTIFLFRRKPKGTQAKPSKSASHSDQQQRLYDQVKRHVQSNNAIATYEALQSLDRHISSGNKDSNSSLQSQLLKMGLNQASEQIDKLKQHLFAHNNTAWNAKTAWPPLAAGLNKLMQSKDSATETTALKPLYPN